MIAPTHASEQPCLQVQIAKLSAFSFKQDCSTMTNYTHAKVGLTYGTESKMAMKFEGRNAARSQRMRESGAGNQKVLVKLNDATLYSRLCNPQYFTLEISTPP